jgi:transposase
MPMLEVQMTRSEPPSPPAFRREAIRRVQAGDKSRNQFARELGNNTVTLRQWVKQADIDAGVRHDGLTTAETEEARRVRREIRTPRAEREILRTAAAYFATAQRAPAAARRKRCSHP